MRKHSSASSLIQEGEAAETQVWIAFAVKCGYMSREEVNAIYPIYNQIIRTLVGMINHPQTWIISDKDIFVHKETEPYGDIF